MEPKDHPVRDIFRISKDIHGFVLMDSVHGNYVEIRLGKEEIVALRDSLDRFIKDYFDAK